LQGRKSGGKRTVYDLGCLLKDVQLIGKVAVWAPLPSDRLNALRKLISENRKVEEAAIQRSEHRREESYGVERTLEG